MGYHVIRAKPVVQVFGLLALCLGVVAFASINNKDTAVSTADHLYPIYSVDIPEKKVALGINCAWDNADIPRLLHTLEEREVKATFFVSGSWCDKYPDSVKALAEAGHEIGSHSNTHTDMTTLDHEGILQEIQRSSEKIEMIVGKKPTVFRTPSGAYNDQVISTIREAGLAPIQWDCDSVDYKEQTPAQMQDRVMANMREGSIFLFHSGGKGTAEAMPQIIDEVQSKGYVFCTVSELILPEPYTVDFEGRQHGG